jgi:hypothetical protein
MASAKPPTLADLAIVGEPRRRTSALAPVRSRSPTWERTRAELVVSDIEAARQDLMGRGVEVSERFHVDGGRVLGPDPERASYMTYPSFRDPDGNTWLLQEVTDRLPGRVWDA